MPSLDSMLESSRTASNFGFSATRIDNLGSTEYTLVNLIVDISGSVIPFASDLEKMITKVVGACKLNPRADSLMLRVVLFNSRLQELHGFKLLQDIQLGDYVNVLQCGGTTLLVDAALNGIEATAAYGQTLRNNDFTVNGVNFVITDGEDVGSTFTAPKIATTLADLQRQESLDSINNILIGINATGCRKALQRFKQEANFDQYEECENADEKTLARLASFISKSISATSQSLGTGQKSQALTF